MKNIFFLLMLFVPNLLFGQTIVGGVVKDSKTSESLPFVNIAVCGSSLGTISNENGEFSISVAEKYKDSDLQFSCVGYKTYAKKVSHFSLSDTISLTAIDYKINEVTIVDKSAAGVKAIKEVVKNISNNYFDNPFGNTGVYTYLNGNYQKTTANVIFYDSNGYSQENRSSAFKNQNWRFKIVNRQKTANDYESGKMPFDYLLRSDIVRYNHNILDISRITDYEVDHKLLADDIINVEFSIVSPSILHCGFPNAKKYSGILKIRNGVILEANYSVECFDKKVECNLIYAQVNNKYFLKNATQTIITNSIVEKSDFVADLPTLSASKVDGKVFYCR